MKKIDSDGEDVDVDEGEGVDHAEGKDVDDAAGSRRSVAVIRSTMKMSTAKKENVR